jgi:hypothetical protein
MPRSIWNGAISFGLITVPVKLYTAIASKTVRFREVHLSDGARIEHARGGPAMTANGPDARVMRRACETAVSPPLRPGRRLHGFV